jgi:Protein of unknown function (DUF3375)
VLLVSPTTQYRGYLSTQQELQRGRVIPAGHAPPYTFVEGWRCSSKRQSGSEQVRAAEASNRARKPYLGSSLGEPPRGQHSRRGLLTGLGSTPERFGSITPPQMTEASTVAQFQDLKRLREAAAWKLLGADTGALVCTCLLALFPNTGNRQVSAAVLHSKLDSILEALRAAGVEPSQPAQGYASDWVSNGWLRRDFPQGAQEEHYSLTVAAGSALRVVEAWRPNVTDSAGGFRLESRLASVRSLMRELEQLTDDDPRARLASLHAEKAAIEYRIQEVEAGRMASIDEDRAAERAREIVAQADQLLGDFDRVRDQFETIHLDLRKRLLQHEGSRRELVEQLLDGIDIIRETDAGRAFQAFWNLLLDPSEVSIFEETSRALASRPFAARLSFDERLSLETLRRPTFTRCAVASCPGYMPTCGAASMRSSAASCSS